MEKGNLLKLSRENDFSVEQCIGMMIEACRGMVYLSNKNIVHRDLALRNILVVYLLLLFFVFTQVVAETQNTQVNKNNVLKIRYLFNQVVEVLNFVGHYSDFGLARYFENFYQPHSNIPIPVRWAAPEVLKQEEITSKSDVFSFAVCMWEILENGQCNLYCLIQKKKKRSHSSFSLPFCFT
jgi:serine/threonine protein kinase